LSHVADFELLSAAACADADHARIDRRSFPSCPHDICHPHPL